MLVPPKKSNIFVKVVVSDPDHKSPPSSSDNICPINATPRDLSRGAALQQPVDALAGVQAAAAPAAARVSIRRRAQALRARYPPLLSR